jgi:hypothetical protein
MYHGETEVETDTKVLKDILYRGDGKKDSYKRSSKG